MTHTEIVNFIWGVADLIRDTFKRGKYQDVILPLTVLRRLDCVLAGTKDRVLKRQAELTTDKQRARLNIITHLLDVIPYEALPRKKVSLPKREIADVADPQGSSPPPREIPTVF